MDINKPGWNQSDQQATAYDPNQQQYYGDGSTYYDPDQAVDPNQAYYPDPNTYPDAAAYYGYGQDGQAYPQDYAQDPNQAYYADPNAYQDPNAYTDPNAYVDPNAYQDPNAYVDPNNYTDPNAYYGYGQDGQAYPQDYAQDPNQAYYAYVDPNAYQDPNAYTDPYYVTSTDHNAYYGQVDNVPALEASDLAYEVTPQEQAAEQELFSEPETKVIREIHEFPFEKIRSYFQTDFDSYNSRLTQLKDKLDNAIFSMRKAIDTVKENSANLQIMKQNFERQLKEQQTQRLTSNTDAEKIGAKINQLEERMQRLSRTMESVEWTKKEPRQEQFDPRFVDPRNFNNYVNNTDTMMSMFEKVLMMNLLRSTTPVQPPVQYFTPQPLTASPRPVYEEPISASFRRRGYRGDEFYE
ncbi:putative proline-rich P65 protein [Mycoplasmoides pneumoniae FH]|uniref:Proline-rich P65 protein n=1 Tax=Mycoplasmoides pneumoniae (strain ATCC 15531 / DSM 23978 / CIP 103766 / NBRC 14401 / NCTC 10119 / FH) TaxID=722438 RepID=P65_MYCPB|nr:RecName: Full=Proline-rich P65 protein [Mycoplasmoides pneumoniae FH]ADK87002.1 putative proline-rich P65 protein [Mycoplasmoides pneumoniae FH]